MSVIQTEEERAQTPCFVGLCGKCGMMLACAVDMPDFKKDTAKSVASWIRDGLTIEKRLTADVRTSEWCKCPRGKKKA